MSLRIISSQLVLYAVVGGLAALVEWCSFYILNTLLCIDYLVATPLSFIASTFANWFFGRILLFRKSNQNKAKELIKIYIVSIAGLLMNLVIMYFAIEKFNIREMPAKILATGIVFIWNFLIRKLLIYKI